MAVKALMYAKKAKEVVQALGGGGTTFALPIQCRQVISFAEDGALANVKKLCDGLKMEEPSGQL